MNMVDVKKVHRGVLIWREDILKAAYVGDQISTVARDLLHEKYKDVILPEADKKRLEKQILGASDARKKRHPNAGSRKPRVLSVDTEPIAIPKKVIKAARFVKGGDKGEAI